MATWDADAETTTALVAGFAVAVPAALAVTRLIGSAMFLVVIVTLVGTGVNRWTYAHVARPDSRPIDDESCVVG